MNATTNAWLGSLFLLLAVTLTFLMFYLWKFPFDKTKHQSSAPAPLMRLHRGLGYLFVLIYLILMWDMVPRLWSYQIELPARTVFHLTLGLTIGAVLIVKIAVVRWFKHLEARLAPILGTTLLICTLLLTGLALPYSAREAYLRMTAQNGQNFSEERVDRVKQYLPELGFSDSAGLLELASSRGLSDGRLVLTKKCTQCHDLRTILAKPRTPEAWHNTVKRMSNRSTILTPISESEQWKVTAYLIAISPTLRKTVSDKRAIQNNKNASERAALEAANSIEESFKTFNISSAQVVFEGKCAQCHPLSLVEAKPPSNRDAAVSLVKRMVRNGLTANDDELSQIMFYLDAVYVDSDTAQSNLSNVPEQPSEATPSRY